MPAFPGAEGYGAFTPGGRGGKHGSGPRYIRSAARYSYNPNNSSVVFGFRVVMEAEKAE